MNLADATIEGFCFERINLAAYIDGELSSHEEVNLERHLEGCENCRIELNEQKKLLQALDFALESEQEIQLPANFTKVVVANAESKVIGLRCPRERFQALFICAALFLLVLLGLGNETKAAFSTFAKFVEQILAIGGFAWKLVYDTAFGTAIVLRSLSHYLFSDSSVLKAILLGAVFISIAVFSRFVLRFNRS